MATGDLVVMLFSAAVVGGLGMVIVPRVIEGAVTVSSGELVPEGASSRAVYERVRALVESSVAVVGWWDRGERGGVELALWHGDVRDPGVVGSDEVVLLSFSPVLGGLAAYVEGGGLCVPVGVEVEGEAPEAHGVALSAWELARGDFGPWWKGRPGIERHLIAAGLSDVRVVHRGMSEGLETLRIELVWGVSRSDAGGDKGVFEVALRRLDAGT